jgi:hypothetical protein
MMLCKKKAKPKKYSIVNEQIYFNQYIVLNFLRSMFIELGVGLFMPHHDDKHYYYF